MSKAQRSLPSVVTLCLAVATGLACGLALDGPISSASTAVLFALDSFIRAWTNGLRAVVLPLIISQLFLAIGAHDLSARRSGRLGVAVAAVFAALLVMTAALTLLGVAAMLRLPVFASLSLPAPAAAAGTVAAGAGAAHAWVDGFVPANIVVAASGDNILPVMLFTCLFALAARRIPSGGESLSQIARAVGDASFVLLRWLMVAAPAVVFALTCKMTNDVGLLVGGVVLSFVVMESVVLVGALGSLYPLSGFVGRAGFLPFARAAAPAQMAALTTRSSLATVPSLMLASERVLGLAPEITAAVIPLAGATLKLSRAVSNTTKLLFLAHVLGIALSPGQVAVFMGTVLLMSPSTPGVPTVTSASRSLPAYVAAGIPAEYVVLLSATTWMTDMLMTVLNSTGYLASAVLVQRVLGAGAESPAALSAAAVPGRIGDEG
jgi:Na+/H+-dicarboxylate symporter